MLSFGCSVAIKKKLLPGRNSRESDPGLPTEAEYAKRYLHFAENAQRLAEMRLQHGAARYTSDLIHTFRIQALRVVEAGRLLFLKRFRRPHDRAVRVMHRNRADTNGNLGPAL